MDSKLRGLLLRIRARAPPWKHPCSVPGRPCLDGPRCCGVAEPAPPWDVCFVFERLTVRECIFTERSFSVASAQCRVERTPCLVSVRGLGLPSRPFHFTVPWPQAGCSPGPWFSQVKMSDLDEMGSRSFLVWTF